MSHKALLSAALSIIRTNLGYTKKDSARTPGGQPHPRCGKWFVSVHKGSRSNQGENRLDEYYSFSVTVTVRVNSPFDRIEENEGDDLEARVDAIRALLHKNETVRTTANTTLGALVNGFVESQVYEGDSEPRLVGGDWFHAEPGSFEVGLAQTLTFGRARRIQTIESMA